MRAIEWTGRFKKDDRRELKGRHQASLDQDLRVIIPHLAADEPLPERYRDHALSGDWKDHRDCHVKPDRVLIQQKADSRTLRRVRLGSVAELSF